MWPERVAVYKQAIGFGSAQVLCSDLCLILQRRGEPHDEDDMIELNPSVALVFLTFQHSEVVQCTVPHKHS
jgi:hypothetical protein